MKKILFNIMICTGLVALASCEKKVTTEDPSKVTHYVVFELQGDETMYVPVNSAFSDPGVSATENGVDVRDHVIVTITNLISGKTESSVNTKTPGAYSIDYSAANADGFSVSSSREVIVYDPAFPVSIAGTYATDMSSTKYGKAGKTFADYAPSYGYEGTPVVTFSEIVPGFYSCSDLLGGWYCQIRGYGARYNMTGVVMLNANNTLTLVSSYVAGWGDGLDYLDKSNYDAATGILSYSVSYAGQIFISPVLVKQ
ncbi:MAG: DUF5012 domain-containing protein [Bacteroidaceae bacterium]|nr:DUF5012 domain-containing protein [Bacteroidaceae bacterium]